MTLTSLVVENFVNSISSNSLKYGGAKGMNVQSPPSMFMLLFVLLLIILIKAFIVYLGYNFIVPKLMYSLSQEENKSLMKIQSKFRPITFVEAIILSIFTSTLFSS
jgi:Tfp pilus assembly protein PilO